MNRKHRVVSLLTLLVLAVFLIVPAASAYDGRTGDSVVVTKDEVIDDDLFVGGTSVTVDGTVNGDLIVGGRTVVVNGKVTGNVIAAGASVTVNGEVGHDVFAAAAAVTIGPDARINHNAYTAAASVESRSGSLIDGTLLIGTGQGLVSGQITKDLLVAANSLRLEGMVGRDARLSVDDAAGTWSAASVLGRNTPPMPAVPGGLTFGREARVTGNLEYVSPKPVAAAGGVSAHVVHTLPPQDAQLSRELSQQQRTSSYLFDALRRLIALLVVGLLIAWLAPRWITGPAGRLLSRPLPSIGIGLVGVVAVPLSWLVALGVIILIAVLFTLLSLGGLTVLTLMAGFSALGAAAVAIVFVLSYLSETIVAYLGGRWILNQLRPERNGSIYAPLLIGLLILGLLFAVPVAGGVLEFLVVLAGLGAIALAIFQRREAPRAPAEVPATVQS